MPTLKRAKRKVLAKKTVPEKAPCEKCKKLVEKQENFCFGCQHVICGTCDVATDPPCGVHAFEDHFVQKDFTW